MSGGPKPRAGRLSCSFEIDQGKNPGTREYLFKLEIWLLGFQRPSLKRAPRGHDISGPAAYLFGTSRGTEALPYAANPAVNQRTLQTIEWNVYPLQIPPAKERLLLIVSAAGQPPSLKLIGKSEVAIGFWTGDAFRVMPGFLRPRLMSSDWQPVVTHWARLAPCLPQGIDLVRDRRFDPDDRD